MSLPHAADDRLTIGSTDDPGEYRSLCGAAVVSLVLGLLSVAALTTPVLLVLPALGIGAGLVALRRIASSEGALTGDGLARAGVVLSAVFLTATLVRGPVRNQSLYSQADAVAQNWVDLLAEGKYAEARQRMAGGAISGMLPEREPGGPAPQESQILEIVVGRLPKDPLGKLAAEHKSGLKLVPHGEPVPPEYTGPVTTIARVYRVGGIGETAPKYVSFSLRRVDGVAGNDDWLIDGWRVADEPPAAAGGQ